MTGSDLICVALDTFVPSCQLNISFQKRSIYYMEAVAHFFPKPKGMPKGIFLSVSVTGHG